MLKILSNLFKKKSEVSGNFIIAQLNDKIMPIDRGNLYEDPLDVFLNKNNLGEVSGGGTLQERTGEIKYCDIEIKLLSDEIEKHTVDKIIAELEKFGAPKGSKLIIEKSNEEIRFGTKEGLAIYLDGKNLPEEVYQQSDINFVLSEIYRLTNIEQIIDRYWEAENVTGLYFYGESFEEMKNRISDFVNTYPLCQNAKIEQIA